MDFTGQKDWAVRTACFNPTLSTTFENEWNLKMLV